MAGKKKSNWGGKRPNSGRKKQTLSQRQINSMLTAARKRAKKEGKTLDDILLDIIYANVDGIAAKVDIKDRLAAIKLFKDFTISKHSEKDINVNDKRQGPAIGLPERKPDPAKLKVVGGGKNQRQKE